MGSLFIKAWCENDRYLVDVKTLIILSIHKVSENPNIKLNIKLIQSKSSNLLVTLDLSEFDYEVITVTPEVAELCVWPVIVIDTHVVSGLCSVARQICKLSNKETVKNLLGFREACLVACAESSVWTKFCEIDIVQTLNNLLDHHFLQNMSLLLPPDILKYENHLSKPVRIHNIYKIARINHNDQSLKSSTSRQDLKVLHEYAEGPYITLADIILYTAFRIFFQYTQNYNFLVEEKVPLVKDWYNRMNITEFSKIHFSLCINTTYHIEEVVLPQVNNVSLYNADPGRTVSVKHTKQYKIESALSVANNVKSEIVNSFLPVGFNKEFNWENIPEEANPLGGALPQKRADRKCHQLENLAKATLEIVGNKIYRIVDFCSGSGHLGILVALLLPKCQIILVENKERSLTRAQQTILKLKLKNIIIVQSNLDYFIANFNLGMALHACGVATDLVLQMCIKNKADFVCCPCCYGGIKDCHEVSYPRSTRFQNVFSNFKEQYFNLAHAADQTHEEHNAKTKQGYFCMDIIDIDRKLFAEGCGYEVHLGDEL